MSMRWATEMGQYLRLPVGSRRNAYTGGRTYGEAARFAKVVAKVVA